MGIENFENKIPGDSSNEGVKNEIPPKQTHIEMEIAKQEEPNIPEETEPKDNQPQEEKEESTLVQPTSFVSYTPKPLPLNPQEQEMLQLTPKDQEYVGIYKEIQLGISKSEPAFVLTPTQFSAIGTLLTSKLEEIYPQNNDEKRIWGAVPILSIVAKGLVEESTKYSTWISSKIAEESKEKESVLICDLCSGAGITSAKMYIELKKAGVKHIQMHAVDNSPESLVAACLLFQTQNIPYTLLDSIEEMKTVPTEYNGIVLIKADAIRYMDNIDQSIKYDHMVSENGISYFVQGEFDKVMTDTKAHLKERASIYIASLNPKLIVKLDPLFLVSQILGKRDRVKEYEERIKRGEEQYETSKEGKISRALTIETGRQLMLMRKLFREDFSEFIKYMGALLKATKAARTLIKEIKTPVQEVDISKVYPNKTIDKYPGIPGSPCDVIGFKV